MPPLRPATAAKADRVVRDLSRVGRLGVAFSGGVDSAVLLALAVEALGPDRVVAILGVSPSLASDEHSAAKAAAELIGARLVEVATREGDRPAYQANGPDRCYHCKDELFATIAAEVAPIEGLTAIAYGENADDAQRIDRPGSKAAAEHEVLRPLATVGLTKVEVREVARHLDLPVADKPAAPCLASRVPHHEPVTPERLRQIDRAERAVRNLGFADCRVRHHGQVARVELLASDLERAMAAPVRDALLAGVQAAGFRFVAIDLAGIQSGAFTLDLVEVRHG